MKQTALILVVAGCAFAADAPQQWTPELSMKVTRVGQVLPSPDGRLVVWTETRAVMEEEKSENLTHIFLGTAGGDRIVQLTRGVKSANAPSFSPDSRHVYFVSPRSGKPNLYRIAVNGGEAVRLTNWKGALGAYRLSPDGKWIAFAGRAADPEQQRAKKQKLDFRVVDEDPPNHSLWIVSSDAALAREHPPRKLFTANYHAGAFHWSADSRRIAFEHRPSPHPDLGRHADISEVEVESGKLRTLANTPATEASPRYSPNGRYLAYAKTLGERSSRIDGVRIMLLDLDSGEHRQLPATFDESPSLLDWAAGSERLLFTEGKRTRAVLYAMPVNGPPEVIYEPESGTLGRGVRLNSTGTHAGFARDTMVEPPEAHVFELSSKTTTRVSRANADLPQLPLGETRIIRWKASDGQEIEGLLTLPVGHESGQEVPLILNIHGGPAGAYRESFIGAASSFPIAAFAANGYAVLRANPRGSAAYGEKFRTAIKKDWGGVDYRDLMAGVDHVIEMGVADPDRMAVMGWSYGGYMTSWVITQTQRFKAATVGAGITNLVSMWGTNDIPSVLDDYFGGTHWEEPDLYARRSAMFHVANVTTPTLILHGAQDPRVPTTQGYEYYNALKRRGVEVSMVTYPRTKHGPNEPNFTLDIMQRNLDWVEKHLK